MMLPSEVEAAGRPATPEKQQLQGLKSLLASFSSPRRAQKQTPQSETDKSKTENFLLLP